MPIEKPEQHRFGRLVIEAGVHHSRTASVYIEPFDGGDPIYLPVSDLVVEAKPHRFVTASLKTALQRVDVAGVTDDGQHARLVAASEGVTRAARYPQTRVLDPDGQEISGARDATWRLHFEQPNTMELETRATSTEDATVPDVAQQRSSSTSE